MRNLECLTNKKVLGWAEQNLKNLETQYVGKAKHLMEEDLPHEIGGMQLRNGMVRLK